jgi:putative hemolysin
MLKYLLAVAALLVIAPGFASAEAARLKSPSDYCQKTGGTVQTRTPEYGTNGGTPLVLAGEHDFCEYTSPDGSTQISVLLSTLVASKPSLAALVYYAKQKEHLKKCEGSPGSCYCSDVGGTDLFGGVNGAGGGWVLTSNVNDVLDLCVFPDLSAIDTYGIFYHSHGIIRGQNLDHKFRFPNPY